MQNPPTTSVRLSRRTWLPAALLASVIFATGSTPADAQVLAADDSLIADVSTYDNPMFMKYLGLVAPPSGLMTVQYSAWKPGGPYNCDVQIYVYDATEGYYTSIVDHRVAFYETDYYGYLYVQPGHYYYYYVLMYMTEAQAQPTYYFFNRIFQVVNGYAPFGTLID